MIISFKNEKTQLHLADEQYVMRWIAEVCRQQGKIVGQISYLFCNDAVLLEANMKYLNHDTYTDIITFDYVDGDVISGDIMISVERVQSNAAQYGVPFEQELHRVIIHGVLHLLGQGDKSEAEAAMMRKKEEAALALWESIK